MSRIKYREFHIERQVKPIPDRSHDYDFWHEDFDGAEDGDDNRCGSGGSAKDCEIQIDDWWENHYSALNEDGFSKF